MCKLKKTFQIYNQNYLYWAYFQTKKSKHTCITSLHTNGVNGPLATTEEKKKKKKQNKTKNKEERKEGRRSNKWAKYETQYHTYMNVWHTQYQILIEHSVDIQDKILGVSGIYAEYNI